MFSRFLAIASTALLSQGCIWVSDKGYDRRLDQDGDGYIAIQFGGSDCDDTDRNVNPDADEIWYDDINQSCKAGSDYDQDGDGLLSHRYDGDDCDDTDAAIGIGTEWYLDSDGDRYGTPDTTQIACTEPKEYVSNASDCNDNTSAINPSQQETCDGTDNNCDGQIDEAGAVDAVIWYEDSDEDGWGNEARSVRACTQPIGAVPTPGDCDDSNSTTYPTAPEICNDRLDNNCDESEDPCGLSAVMDLRYSRQIEIMGTTENDYFGAQVAGVGDLDGDGAADFVVASHGQSEVDTDKMPGAVRLFWGGTEASDLFTDMGHAIADEPKEFTEVYTSDDAARTQLGENDDQLGYRIAAINDFDNDGFKDFAVSAPGHNYGTGRITLYRGNPLRALGTPIQITGPALQSFGGTGIGPAGDVNNDGYADLWIGSSNAGFQLSTETGVAQQKAGRVFLVPGPIESDLHLKDMEFSLGGSNTDVQTGRNIAGNCDINGDGSPDLLVSGKTGTEAGGAKSGVIFLLYEGFDNIGEYAIRELADASFVGVGAGASAGTALACSDMNGDGFDDIITSSPDFSDGKGSVDIQLGGQPYSMNHSLFVADWTLKGSKDDHQVGLTMVTEFNTNGDVRGDGSPIYDLLLTTSAFHARPEALLFEGPFTTGTYDREDATAVFYDGNNNSLLNIGNAGDVNADGLDDLLFGNDAGSKGVVFLQLGEGL